MSSKRKRPHEYQACAHDGGNGPPPEKFRKTLQYQPPTSEEQMRDKYCRPIITKRHLGDRESICTPRASTPRKRLKYEPPPHIQHPRVHTKGRLKTSRQTRPIQKQIEPITKLQHVPMDMHGHSAPRVLHKLATENIIGHQLHYMRSDQFFQFINSAEECSDDQKMSLFIKILHKLLEQGKDHVRKQVANILHELLRNQTLFLPCLSSIISKMPLESHPTTRINFINFLGDVHLLFWKMLERCPPLLSCIRLPIDTLAGSTRQLADQEIRFQEINEKVQQLVKKRDDIRSEHYQLKAESSKGEDDAALPTPAELRMKTMPLDLNPNKIQGCYSTIQEYLTLQYRLLREDFINPLRTALNKLQDDEDCQEVKVYENVQFNKGETYTQGETAFKVSFKVPDQRLVNWEHSKRFMYGSLLCLSHDNFQTVIFATVAERDINQLKQGVVTIKVENGHDGLSISPRTVYRMAESAGYYGAYAPILKHLKSAMDKPEQLPFLDYLVECRKQVQLPAYLRSIKETHDRQLNFTGVLCKCPQRCIHKNIDILDAKRWSELDVTLLDPSQKEALYTALTNELAMIQGPPGTGKTYIGLKILETLLINQHLHCSASRRPIVVVCYTNHALDQFLEGVIKIGASIQKNVEIRRVGGRCKSEQVEKYNIRHYLQRACRHHGLHDYSINRLKRKIEALDELLDGKYNQLNCHIYAYFFGQQFVWELKNFKVVKFFLNHFDTNLAALAWLCPEFNEAVAHYYDKQCVQPFSHHQAVEDDRKITESEEDDMFLFRILGEEVIKKFVFNLKSVAALTDKRAHLLCSTHSGVNELKWSNHNIMRLQLFKFCLEKVKPILKDALTMTELKREEFEKEREMIMIKCLKDADVIGLTTTGAAKHHPILSQIGAKIVLIEEAAEVLEAHVLATLTQHTQHLILIGDHKQLRPKTNDYILARDYKLDISLFERLVNNKFPCVTLKVQHRMRPEISKIVSSEIYNGTLEDAPTTEQYCDIKGMKHNLYFVDHTESETPNEELKSPANDHEAAFLAHLCRYLLQQGYKPEEITVITPYTGQMFNLRRTFKQAEIENVRITPIDSYQGEENEIILLSLVRSNTAGFVKDDNRVCVALSRAKQGLYCIGNFSRLFQHSSKLWESIVSTLKAKQLIGECLPLRCARHKNITEVSSAKDFDAVKDGGCTEPCNHRLPCNHVCPSKCHPSEESHKRPCREPCPKYCPNGQHRCRRLCYEVCGDCEELVDKLIPKCKHVQKVPCYKNPVQFICQEKCSKILPCEHPCTNTCGDVCTTECRALVKRTWLCGHEAQAECYKTEQMYTRTCQAPCEEILKCEHPCRGKCGKCRQGRLHAPCQENCDRTLICGHKCSGKCAKNCPPCNKQCIYSCPHGPCGHDCRKPCQECPHRCEWKCEHLKCTRNCGEPCDRERCDEPCLKSLSCGHPCLGLCGEPCLSICKECNKEEWEKKVPLIFGTEEEPEARFIQLSDCQHIFEVSGLDYWLDGNNQEKAIQWRLCPLCNQPVIKTLRYANIAKQIIKDINKVKCGEWYVLMEENREEIRAELSKMASSTPLIDRSVSILQYQSHIMTFPDVLLSQEYLVFKAAAVAQESKKTLDTWLAQLDTDCMDPEKKLKDKTALLKAEIEDFIEWLKLSRKRGILTDQMQEDVRAEQNRISLLTQIYTIQQTVLRNGVRLEAKDKSFLETTLECYEAYGTKLSESKKLTDDMYALKQHNLKMLTHRYTQLEGLTEEEKTMIVKAIGAKSGSWYKCPKGHFYHIGECGGAMETGTCPECKAPIGGHRHQLLSDNAHAGEFDRSQHAAWSEGANMGNYQL